MSKGTEIRSVGYLSCHDIPFSMGIEYSPWQEPVQVVVIPLAFPDSQPGLHLSCLFPAVQAFLFQIPFMQGYSCLFCPFPSVLCNRYLSVVVRPFSLAVDDGTVMVTELPDMEHGFRKMADGLVFQDTAGNTIRIRIVVFCEMVVIPVNFRAVAIGYVYHIWIRL